MGSINLTATQAAAPFFLHDFNVEDIQPDAFDPITTLHDADNVHPTEMPWQRMVHKYERKGFLVRPNADGHVYVITKAQYDAAIKKGMTLAQRRVILAGLDPKPFNGKDGEWIEVPVVKVFGTAGDGAGHYLTIATEVEVGIIL